MSVETLYTDTDQKDVTKRAVVAGIGLGEIYQVTWEFSVGRVPTATIIVPNPIPVFAEYFSDVTIDVGFNALTERVFTGKVMNVAANERQTEIACAGLSQFLDKPSEDVTILIDNTDNITVLNTIFSLAGISFFEIALPTTPLGTNVVSTLQFQSFAEAVDKVAEIDGGRWIELPSGLIRVIVADPIPQASTNRTYFTMNLTGLVESRPAGLLVGRPRIRTMRKGHDVAKVKNRIHVRGAAVTTGDLTEDIERTVSGPSEFVLNPDGTQAFNDLLFANDLIDNNALADAVVARLLLVNNRLLTVLALGVDGDPLRRLGESIRVEDESYPVVSGRFFLERYRSVIGQRDFITQLTLLGEGTSTGEDPVAEVTFCQMLNVVIDDRKYTIVTLDGRGSFSPSGVAITTYAWTDNQTPVVATGSDPVISVRIDPTSISPEPWTITLTVTDANGNSDVVTVTIDPTECQEDCVNIATLFTAFETDSSGSADGGETWNDDSQNSISVAAHPSVSGLAIYGTDGGVFYRTTDYAASVTLVHTTGSGSPVRDITWDPDNHDVVWAVLDNAEVWRSVDQGVTWSQYANLRVVLPGIENACGHRIKIVGGTALVFGGRGNGDPLIAMDVNKTNSWVAANIGGDLRSDLDATLHFTALYVADGAVDELWRLAIILNDPAFTPAVFYTNDLFGDGSAWTRATALPAKSLGRWLDADMEEAKFVFQFDDDVIYLGDVTAGVMATTVAAAALDAGDGANHGFWLGGRIPGLGSVYIVDGEGAVDGTIYISWDRFANIGKIRPATGFPAAPAGANAQMTDLGAPGLCPELYAQGERVGFPQATAQLRGTTWGQQSSDAGLTNWHLISLNGVLYRIANIQGVTVSGGLGDLERSDDLGVTWSIVIGQNTIDQWGVSTVTIGPDGVLWAATRATLTTAAPLRVYKSTDNGLTWTRVLTGFEGTGGAQHRASDLAVDPFNANNIVLSGSRFPGNEIVLVSTDGGVNWVSKVGVAGQGFWIAFGDSGRLVAATNLGISTSDDLGTTWVSRDALVGASATAFIAHGPNLDELVYPHENGVPQWRLRRSRDNGQTWEELANETDLYGASGEPLWSGTFLKDGSLVIGTRPNASDGPTPVTIWRQANPFATVVPAFSTWENWTYNWGVTIGAGDLALQGLASILRDGH